MQYRIDTNPTSAGIRVTIKDLLGRVVYFEDSGNESAYDFMRRMKTTARAMAEANVKGDVPPHQNFHAKKVAEEVRNGKDPAKGGRFSDREVAEADARHKRWVRDEMPDARKRLENLSERIERLAAKLNRQAKPPKPSKRLKMSEAWREVKPGIFRFRGLSQR